ncbi:MAG: hypothetical protein ISS70_11055 [Phycisphaerae bacterium]|nr:hypothetical protein [Phycisphaerae bacterium]
MKWFRPKQKSSTVSPTKVLVSAVGADEELAAMADCDAGIYEKHYANVTNTPVSDADSLVDIIKTGAFDLVHVLANVNTDGTIGRTHADRVLRTCAKTDVKLVFFAAENPYDAYGPHFQPGPLNLIMTMDRRGDDFPVFLDGLLGKMSSGTTMPIAWKELLPPIGAAPEDIILEPACILDVRQGGVVLLGKDQTVALNAQNAQGRTLLSQGVGIMSGFSFTRDGDVYSGPFIYREEDRRVNIYWEWSIDPNHDIGFGYIDLREWHEPKGTKIDKEHQLKILRKLRQWLKDQNVKSPLDLPLEIETTDRPCHWANCSERKTKGSAYCPRHRDLSLLRE